MNSILHRVGEAHRILIKDNKSNVMQELINDLPKERVYTPHMDEKEMEDLALLPGKVAQEVAEIGFGQATEVKVKAKR